MFHIQVKCVLWPFIVITFFKPKILVVTLSERFFPNQKYQLWLFVLSKLWLFVLSKLWLFVLWLCPFTKMNKCKWLSPCNDPKNSLPSWYEIYQNRYPPSLCNKRHTGAFWLLRPCEVPQWLKPNYTQLFQWLNFALKR